MRGIGHRGALWTTAAAAVAAALTLLAPATATAADCTLPGPADTTMSELTTVMGEFSDSHEGSFVYVPFDVPAGATAVRVRYCHDQPELLPPNPAPNSPKHVLDLGLYESRPTPTARWGEAEFRGWGGSSTRDVTVAENGFSSDAVYELDRKAHVTGRTTRAYVPGQIPSGEWAAELGVAAVAARLLEGDLDGKVAWKVRVETSGDEVWADDPYAPTPYDPTAADPDPAWYAGDFHVHGEHEPGNATMRETFDYAFAPYGGDGAGLDFVTLVDHNNVNAYSEIGRYQADYPGKLIVRSTEVTTYRGHLQNHASGELVDYRTGPLLERRDDGSLSGVRPARPASEPLGEVIAAGGFTQINHPTIFPSAVPTFDDFCRGCSWDYSAAETDYSRVDAIEVSTGPAGLHQAPNPGPNPFTPLAIQFWEQAIDSGGLNANRIAAVGSSDSHKALKRQDLDPQANVTDAPIGMATTVVFADELSEQEIADGVRAGHTYVKPWGADGPDLRLEAEEPGSPDPPAIIGDGLDADSASFTARVLNLDQARAARPGSYTLFVLRNGQPFMAAPIPATGDEFTFEFEGDGPARYRLQVEREASGAASIEAISSPIYLGAPGSGDGGDGDGDGDPAAECSREIAGTRRDDSLRGAEGSERIRGRRGDDRLKGKGGGDCLGGGKGADRVAGGSGVDRIRAGGGHDVARAVDGERDEVRCGKGDHDVARVDGADETHGCERLRIPNA